VIDAMKPWYLQTDKQVQTFFDVDSSEGLDEQNALVRLKKFGPNTDPLLSPEMQGVYQVWVKRQGQPKRIPLIQLVPGDIVILNSGDRVPADLRLIKVNDLYIDQSILTGDSLPMAKNTFALNEETPFADQKCMAYAGSFVSYGSGLGIVVAHGDKLAIKNILPKIHHRHNLTPNLAERHLKKAGVVVQNAQASHLLGSIDVVFIDAEMPDEKILEIIRKVQFSHGLPCKFLLTGLVAKRLKRELLGALIYPGDQLAKHVPKQFLGMIIDAQFTADAALSDVLKLVCTMQRHGTKVLWVSDGKKPTPIIQAATVSLLVGDLARGDCIARADLIAPGADATVLTSILYNKK